MPGIQNISDSISNEVISTTFPCNRYFRSNSACASENLMVKGLIIFHQVPKILQILMQLLYVLVYSLEAQKQQKLFVQGYNLM